MGRGSAVKGGLETMRGRLSVFGAGSGVAAQVRCIATGREFRVAFRLMSDKEPMPLTHSLAFDRPSPLSCYTDAAPRKNPDRRRRREHALAAQPCAYQARLPRPAG